MSLEEEKKVNQNEWVRQLLNKSHKAELWNILAFWEKYKKEGDGMEREFWNDMEFWWYREDRKGDYFKDLILQYNQNKEKFVEWLSKEEIDILESLGDVGREKFFRQYFFGKIVYSWNVKMEAETGDTRLYLGKWDIESFKKWVSDMKNELQPGMSLLMINRNVWVEWVKLLAKEWKGRLQPWMHINLRENEIWEDWIRAIMDNWELKEWMRIWLSDNNISNSMEGELIKWIEWYNERWIKCYIDIIVF